MDTVKANLARVLVITGSIGSGKSTAASILAEAGAVVVSADELAREVVEPGAAALPKIAATFGREFLLEDGTLNRAKVAELVFGSAAALQRLEALLHPEIAKLSERKIASAQADGAPLVVYDCPLYFEAGLDARGFGAVLLITSDRSDAESRVAQRDTMSAADFEKRRQAQLGEEVKRARADFVVENDGTIEDLRKKLEALRPQLFAVGTSATAEK